MRQKIALYIGGQPVDLDDQSFILFNYTMEDMSNPTIVRNSFSKQVTIKGTPNNNKVFGGMFRLDRQTQYGDSYVGGNFDASRKTPFSIYNEMNEIVESGYVKLDEVVRTGNMVEYKVTLYGGLGSFLYGLMYKDDGSKLTLADLRYRLAGGGYTTRLGYFGQSDGFAMLMDGWDYLRNPGSYDFVERENKFADKINFAPCYNGLPDSFSADKAVCNKPFDNVPNYRYIQKENSAGQPIQVQYSFKSGTSSSLMTFTNPHTEWEIRDLRWYLQRPIIRLKAILEAISDSANNGGWSVGWSDGIIEDDLYDKAWITLPLIPVEDRKSSYAIPLLLGTTKSPAEYLIAYVKMLGLVMLCDDVNKTISISTRQEFFGGSKTIDLTERIDVKNITISPVLAQSNVYQFGSDAIGEFAKTYKDDFGLDYGIQRVVTGNEFNGETTIVTKDLMFKDAVDVQERNLLFTSNALTRGEAGGKIENFILPRYESVKLQLWGTVPGDSEQSMEEVDVLCPYEWNRFFNNPSYPLADWLPKVQFHEGNKSVDGSDVMLFFNGVKDAPAWTTWARLEYRLSDDTDDMTSLNDGQPCWNFTDENCIKLTTLPSFRRCMTSGDQITYTLEWGVPKARGVNGESLASDEPTIYRWYWRKYQTDRYDDDTFKMTCKVNLRGLSVGQGLMQNFFYYQNAIFVLNKISNHSLTTLDDTECEFIKVQDIDNYRQF